MSKHKKRKSNYVKPYKMNWDGEFYHDILSGNGFIINEPPEITLDGSRKKSLYGPQSPLYGTTYEDEHSFIERYRCSCPVGGFTGRMFEGEICPICGQPVTLKDSDIEMTGWISFGFYSLINPYYYRKLESALGKDIFKDIINAKYIIDIDGNRKLATADDLDYNPLSIYSGIGIYEFKNQYEDIMEHFKLKRKNKADVIDMLIIEKRKVFTSHVPIPSTLLRPQTITGDSFYYETIDKLVNTLYNLSESLKKSTEVERDFIMGRIETKLNKMWDVYFSKMNGKNGHIRGKLLGGELNYTARNVIVPDPSLKDNEIDISYHTFLELAKYKIIYYIMKIYDIPLAKAYNRWSNATNFDEGIYDIMTYIIETSGLRLLIHRNPTLNFYSMVLMRIRKVTKSDDNFSLAVPLSILPGMNADFDGDILNIIGLVDSSMSVMFRKFDPIKRMIIDRDTGLLNNYFTIQKDQLIVLNAFCTIGEMPNDTKETFPVKDKDGNIIYVEESEIEAYGGIVDVDPDELKI